MVKSEEQENRNKLSDFARAMRKAAPYLNIPYLFIAGMGLFGLIGWLVDRYLETFPVFFIAGIVFGLLLGFYNLYRLLVSMEKKQK